jgi:hypothetical protein
MQWEWRAPKPKQSVDFGYLVEKERILLTQVIARKSKAGETLEIIVISAARARNLVLI